MSYSNPQISPLLPNLATLLSSPKGDDEISEELAEMFGFDGIELVMEVLGNRLPLSYKVRAMVFCDCYAVANDVIFS